MPEKCYVHNCTAQAVSHGLCDTHRKRLSRHGTLEATRPNDWGRREKHPLYKSWCGLIRYHKFNIPEPWQDFWTFVKEVPERPSEYAKIYRPDKLKPWSLNNFFWKETSMSEEARKDRASYMRIWQKNRQSKNFYYSKNSDLKKSYGVDIDWFNLQFDLQNGVCLICKQPETTIIKGRTISLSVDHCHDTGKVRGLLCKPCNQGIGIFKHDLTLLQSAIDYLKKHGDGAS
jgi:hypothetical protein